MVENAGDWGKVWRDQPGGPPLDARLLRQRGSELSARTRAETLWSLAAAAVFLAVVGWRFAALYGRIPVAGLVVAAVWLAVSVVWFRRRPVDSLAESGVEHYRRELERRRDHLRNEWIWNGPLVAACVTLATVVGSPMAFRNWNSVAIPLAVLAVWVVFSTVRRRRQAAGLQREIDELRHPH